MVARWQASSISKSVSPGMDGTVRPDGGAGVVHSVVNERFSADDDALAPLYEVEVERAVVGARDFVISDAVPGNDAATGDLVPGYHRAADEEARVDLEAGDVIIVLEGVDIYRLIAGLIVVDVLLEEAGVASGRF